jgi:hypothetical protein
MPKEGEREEEIEEKMERERIVIRVELKMLIIER